MVMGDLPLSVHPHHGIHKKKATAPAMGMECAPSLAAGTIATVWPDPTLVVEGLAAVEMADRLTPVVVATAQVEEPTSPSLAAAGEHVGPIPAVAGMVAASAAGPSPAGVDAPSHVACGAAERPPSQTPLLHERRALCGRCGDDARCKERSAQPASR